MAWRCLSQARSIDQPSILFGPILLCLALGLLLTSCTSRPGLPTLSIDPAVYQRQLQAMWLGAAIGNWTGRITEAARTETPFYTDDDWGTLQRVPWKDDEHIDFVWQDPWLADDDTDIEYLYLHLMNREASPLLTAEQLAAGWQQHVNDHIWFANASARQLIELGAEPPVTGMLPLNANALMIDAQLTTEIFGALAPGLPNEALRLADLPIRLAAAGYAAHAAQFYVLLYALAPAVAPAQTRPEQIMWLIDQARAYLPDSSKSATIIDFVVAAHRANPDKTDWEYTRDEIYLQYQLEAGEHGYVYRGWAESSINLAATVMALLYGEGDFRRTVQIAALAGWDSDNGAATLGGLLGLLYGYDDLLAQFPDRQPADRYQISRTRPGLPDYLPTDPDAEDTFAGMAARMLPLVAQTIIAAGGDTSGDRWQVPDRPAAENPLQTLMEQSHNVWLNQQGGKIKVDSDVSINNLATLGDGLEFDFTGEEIFAWPAPAVLPRGDRPVAITITYERPISLAAVRLIEGAGGGFVTLTLALPDGSGWQPVALDPASSHPDPDRAYEILDLFLPEPRTVLGYRLIGRLPATGPELEILEITGLSR